MCTVFLFKMSDNNMPGVNFNLGACRGVHVQSQTFTCQA